MAALAWVMLAVATTQPAPGPTNAPPAPAPPARSPSGSTSLDELVVTAPRPAETPVYRVVTGPRALEFEGETARRQEMKIYRDTGVYPGLRCALLHHC